MKPLVLNPDNAAAKLLMDQPAKFLALMLYKLKKTESVFITVDDMLAYENAFPGEMAYLMTHGHSDSIEFRIVSESSAHRLAQHDASLGGSA